MDLISLLVALLIVAVCFWFSTLVGVIALVLVLIYFLANR